MELGGGTWWCHVWRSGDKRSIGSSNRFGRGLRGVANRLAVGVGCDCGECVLVVGCVCVFLLVYLCWVLTWGWGSDPWSMRDGRRGRCVFCTVSGWGLRVRPWGVMEGSEAIVCGWVSWVCGLLVLCLYLYDACRIRVWCVGLCSVWCVGLCSVWSTVSCATYVCVVYVCQYVFFTFM